MQFSKLALVMGSAMALAAGTFFGSACSSSSSNSGNSSGSSGGGSGSGSGGTMDATADTGNPGDDGGSGTDTGTPEGDGGTMGPDCGSIPSLHQDTAGDIYCGYGADGGSIHCTTGTQCCLGGEVSSSSGYSPQDCTPWTATGGGCDNPAADSGAMYAAIGIACNQTSDCAANGMTGSVACCLQGAKGPNPVTGCGYDKASSGTAVVCEATTGGTTTDAGYMVGTCLAGETQICSSDTDCPTGTTCKPGKWKIYQIGFCQ